jgi:hypothetical protein
MSNATEPLYGIPDDTSNEPIKVYPSGVAAGTVLDVEKVDNFSHRVTFVLSNGDPASLTTVWERLPKVGDVYPPEFVQVFEHWIQSGK